MSKEAIQLVNNIILKAMRYNSFWSVFFCDLDFYFIHLPFCIVSELSERTLESFCKTCVFPLCPPGTHKEKVMKVQLHMFLYIYVSMCVSLCVFMSVYITS